MECFSMMRISMSLPKKLLADFDEVLKERGYQSRSKGIRDALQDYIVRHQWMNEMKEKELELSLLFMIIITRELWKILQIFNIVSEMKLT